MKLKIIGYYVPASLNPEEINSPIAVSSKNAETAKKGFKAETLFCETPIVRDLLETYFNKKIVAIRKQVHRKKSDVVVDFDDGTTSKIQNKNGNSKKSRGWSADRRSIDKMPLNDDGKLLLKNVCLHQDTYRPVVAFDPTLIKTLLTGVEDEYMPTYHSHTSFNDSGELLYLSICPTETLISEFISLAHPTLVAKKTCVHINKHLYLQRKGGGSKDHSPNDIQLKLTSFPQNIMTTLYDKNQTTQKSV